jgi:prepilin-type N-terminal cleavage/methylation domain-containing protein/prepilin-type processing-associated H-X9-DG protein
MKKRNAGFTLVELVVVVLILGILAALLLPAISKSKVKAERTVCTGNLRQWGVAISMYAGENHNSFPDNRDGSGLSWCGSTVQSFWTNYLVPLVINSADIDKRFHVLFCPTEKWHRAADLLTNTGYGRELSVGYFYLPFRDPGFSNNVTHQLNYDAGGIKDWVARRKLGGEFSKAPIAMDQKQGLRKIGGAADALQWFGVLGIGANPTKPTPYSSHIQRNGEPFGGNYLFEDGHVAWFASKDIAPAATADNWIFFYKVPVE